MDQPAAAFPLSGSTHVTKAAVAVRCCPRLFQLREAAESPPPNEVFSLPWRVVFAVATLDAVLFYDTQQSAPFAALSGIHYASITGTTCSSSAPILTSLSSPSLPWLFLFLSEVTLSLFPTMLLSNCKLDMAWTPDGSALIISSRDGYCTAVTFDEDELGEAFDISGLRIAEGEAEQAATTEVPKAEVPPVAAEPDNAVTTDTAEQRSGEELNVPRPAAPPAVSDATAPHVAVAVAPAAETSPTVESGLGPPREPVSGETESQPIEVE
jgi:hypothetical protein